MTDSLQLLPDGRRSTAARDYADAGMDLAMLEGFLEDQQAEPPWRKEADICADYYDGNQLTQDELEELEEKGLGALMRNVIAPTLNAMLGLEERNRTDWKAVSDYDDEADVADALTARMAEAERNSHADQAISNAYAGELKAGFAAVEVSRHSNPFEYRYRIQDIHRRELYWDPKSRRNDWKDARFLMRRRWYDLDIVCAHFPAHAQLLAHSIDNWANWDPINLETTDDTNLAQSMQIERGFRGLSLLDWRNTNRRRVCINEVWYRTWKRGDVIMLPRDRVVEFDESNPQHVALRRAGALKIQTSVYDKLRCAYFAGPHRLADYASSLRDFPYVPFWGYREDLTGIPYGVIRNIISGQDEVNARLAKMMWLLTARRTQVDADALDTASNTLTDLSHEIGKADAFIVRNPNRRNANAIEVDENLALAEAQRAAMNDAINAIQMISGSNSTLFGNSGNGVTAGTAIDKLVEQSVNAHAEINANYTWARREVGSRLMAMVREDMTETQAVTIDDGTNRRRVQVNIRIKDPETGLDVVKNSIKNTSARIALGDVPSTPAYREQQFGQLSEVAKSLPPEAQQIVLPYIIEASSMPKRKEIAKALREKLGMFDASTPEGQQAAQAAQQQAEQQVQIAAQQLAQAQADQQAKTEKTVAETEKIRSETVGQGAGQDGQSAADAVDSLAIEQAKIQSGRDIAAAKISSAERIADQRAQIDQTDQALKLHQMVRNDNEMMAPSGQ